MKIILSEPDGPYNCVIETGGMDVQIRENFLGLSFATQNGEKLDVLMRDSGFEVHYSGDFGELGFDTGWINFKNGNISQRG